MELELRFPLPSAGVPYLFCGAFYSDSLLILWIPVGLILDVGGKLLQVLGAADFDEDVRH